MGRDEVFVNKESMALFICPDCGKMKHVSVAKFKNAKHSLQVKCNCGKTFPVDLNFRSRFRKDTSFSGCCYNVLDERPVPSMDRSNCTIVNLSLGGIGIKLNEDKQLVIGDEVRVEFVLDDRKNSEIKRNVIVRHIGQDQYVGGEFSDNQQNLYDKIIGFYLMS